MDPDNGVYTESLFAACVKRASSKPKTVKVDMVQWFFFPSPMFLSTDIMLSSHPSYAELKLKQSLRVIISFQTVGLCRRGELEKKKSYGRKEEEDSGALPTPGIFKLRPVGGTYVSGSTFTHSPLEIIGF